MNHKTRMEICLNGELPDRPPVALWRHFPVDDQKADTMAAAHINFQQTYDFDFLKVTPASGYFLYDWGLEDVWQGHPHGTREVTKRVIHNPDDWFSLEPLDPYRGHLKEQIDALIQITETLGSETPVIHTIFNPLSQAKKMVGDDLLFIHLREHPEALHQGLQTIAESSKDFIQTIIQQTGVAGIFFAVQHAQSSMLTEEEYLEFGRPYDFPLLQAAADGWLNLLHLHGTEIYFDSFIDYPVQIINWHDQETAPNLLTGLEKFPGVVCGGIRQETTLNLGTPAQIEEEARRAIEATGGNRFILGTGCVAYTTTPHGNLNAARKIVEQYRLK